jgi:hypothetical protein
VALHSFLKYILLLAKGHLADCRSADSHLADWHGTTKSKEGQKEKK